MKVRLATLRGPGRRLLRLYGLYGSDFLDRIPLAAGLPTDEAVGPI